MSPTALALVLMAGFLHAVWNMAAKKAGGDDRFAFIVALLVAVIWGPVAWYVGDGAWLQWGATAWLVLIASALVHVAYFTVLLTGYRRADLTVVYPVARGTGPLLASAMALVVLNESLSWLSLGGVLAVCLGIFWVAGGAGLWRQSRDPQVHARTMTGLRWGFATGVLIASYTVIDGYAVTVLLIGPVIVDYVGNVLRIPLLLPGALRDRTALRAAWATQWRHAVVVAVLGPLAYVLVLYAMQLAPLSHVAPAREVSMLFAALLGGKLLGERDQGARVLGALCMALGVFALAVS